MSKQIYTWGKVRAGDIISFRYKGKKRTGLLTTILVLNPRFPYTRKDKTKTFHLIGLKLERSGVIPIIRNKPILYHNGKDCIKQLSKKVKAKEKNIDLILLLILLPKIKQLNEIIKPKKKIKLKLKFFTSSPCKVAKIFHIETKQNKKNEETIE